MKNLKPIKWRNPVVSTLWWYGETSLWSYYICNYRGWFSCEWKYRERLKSFRSLDAAKAYCSSHYAAAVEALFDDADTTLKGTQ